MKFLKALKKVLLNCYGMATLNCAVYDLSQQDPIQKSNPGDMNTRNKVAYGYRVLSADLALNDVIDSVSLPEGALVTDAILVSHQSMGTQGKIQLGHKGGETFTLDADGEMVAGDVAADPDAFVSECDAGGQPAVARLSSSNQFGRKLGRVGIGGLQLQVKCTEASDAITANDTVLVEWFVFYTLIS